MKLRTLLWLVALVLAQSACSIGGVSTPARFYVLDAVPGAPATGGESAKTHGSLAVGPVTLPDIFDRPQIVTRHGANRIELAEFDRWSGDLGQNLTRVLTENLMDRLPADAVAAYPWRGGEQPVYQVAVRFSRFDGEPGRFATIAGHWQLLDGRDGCQLRRHRFTITETPQAADYEAYVQALSAGLARLGGEIAAALVTTNPGCR